MNCPKCQALVSADWIVCPKCGTQLNQPSSDVAILQVKRPSRWQYFTGTAIVLVTSALAMGLLFAGLFLNLINIIPEMRMVMPGTHDIELDSAGKYTVFWEYQSFFEGVLYGGQTSLSGMTMWLYDDNSNLIEMSLSSGTSKYEANGRAGVSLAEFEIDEPGTYTIIADYKEGDSGSDIVLAISRYSLRSSLISFIWPSIIGTLGFIIGLIIIIRAIVMRRNIGRREGVTPVDRFWC